VRETTIREAAELLGLSQATIKRRLHRGEMKGRQAARPQGFFWLVEIDEDLANHRATTRTSDGDRNRDSTGTAELTTMITWLQEELTNRRREVQELHTLLAQQTALNAGRRPWWRFWK